MGNNPLGFQMSVFQEEQEALKGPFGNENANVYWCPLPELLLSQGEG